MKKFDVQFTYTSEGIVTVEATNAEEAESKVAELLKHGLPLVEASYVGGGGTIEFVDEVKE